MYKTLNLLGRLAKVPLLCRHMEEVLVQNLWDGRTLCHLSIYWLFLRGLGKFVN